MSSAMNPLPPSPPKTIFNIWICEHKYRQNSAKLDRDYLIKK